MNLYLEEHEITTILSALDERPHKEVAALIHKIVHQMANEKNRQELHSGAPFVCKKEE